MELLASILSADRNNPFPHPPPPEACGTKDTAVS